MMDRDVLMECLKLIIWTVFGIVRYFADQKREKAMIASTKKTNHRLNQLEKKIRKLP